VCVCVCVFVVAHKRVLPFGARFALAGEWPGQSTVILVNENAELLWSPEE